MVVLINVMAACGFTVTVNVKELPLHPPTPESAIVVTVYTAVCNALVELLKLPVMLVLLLPLAPPVIPPDTVGTDQLYKVPTGTVPLVVCAGVIWNNTPSQVTAVIAVIDGRGFTVITTVKLLPIQLPVVRVGRTINVTD
jgi:hypothetical protein